MRPSEFVRAFFPEHHPLRLQCEAASARIQGGPGLYPHPECPQCHIMRRTGWRSRFQYYAHEERVYCAQHLEPLLRRDGP